VPADPDGTQRWHLCDGTALSRTTYATLFSAIGTTYGTGDGSTTFNIPDLLGRVPVGAGAGSGLTARALGVKSGQQEITTVEYGDSAPNHGVAIPSDYADNNMPPYTTIGHIVKIA